MEKRWLLLLPPILTSLCSQKNNKSSFSFSSQKSSPLLSPKNNLSPCASFALSPFQAKKSLICFRKIKKSPSPDPPSFFYMTAPSFMKYSLSFIWNILFPSFFLHGYGKRLHGGSHWRFSRMQPASHLVSKSDPQRPQSGKFLQIPCCYSASLCVLASTLLINSPSGFLNSSGPSFVSYIPALVEKRLCSQTGTSPMLNGDRYSLITEQLPLQKLSQSQRH